MARIVLAMSGGVDSSVAAWLLREQGHDVVGLFMRHGQTAPAAPTAACPAGGAAPRPSCCSAADAHDARRVADALGIPFFVLDFESSFTQIVARFAAEYAAGRTPNPCILCNSWLKFGKLFEYAEGIGADALATGHYARMALVDGETVLLRGIDASKDQSYVLFGIRRELLPRLRLPVGEYTKAQIRQFAAQCALPVADKRDSQEICFIPDQDHARFVREYLGRHGAAGEIVTVDGRLVGRHDGIERFTVGQRKGLGVALGEPRYVVRIEAETARVVLGGHEDLARRELSATEANWLSAEAWEERTCQVKIRYRSAALPARVRRREGDCFSVSFDEPCYGVAPGQAVVCYDGDRVLGGGWIA